jgi:Na+(H+)/acetate symporter ActP
MLTTIWTKVKQYWQLIAAAAIGLLYLSWKERGNEIGALKSEAASGEVQGEIKQLKETQDVQQKQFNNDVSDYDTLKHADAELASKLGLD